MHLAPADAPTSASTEEPEGGFRIGDQPGPVVTDLWDDGCAAARAGETAKAHAYFAREATLRAKQRCYGRAAVAFRAAAQQARLSGDAAASDRLLRDAASAYLRAADDGQLAPDTARAALVAAAKCFLHVEDLEKARRCIERAGRGTQARNAAG